MNEILTGILTEILIAAGIVISGIIAVAGKKFTAYLEQKSNATYDSNRNDKLKAITEHLYQVIESVAVPKLTNTVSSTQDAELLKVRVEAVTQEIITLIGDDTIVYLEKHLMPDMRQYINRILLGKVTTDLATATPELAATNNKVGRFPIENDIV